MAVAAVALLYLVLHLEHTGPHDGYWSVDQGVKWLQAETLARNGFTGLAISYPGASVDSSRRFSPVHGGQFVDHGGRSYGMFSTAFAALSAAGYRLGGPAGLRWPALLAGIGLVAAGGALAARILGRRWGVLAALLLALATPVSFYSLAFWEHTPAAFFVTCGLWQVAAAMENAAGGRPGWRSKLALAGFLVGLAAWFRVETVLAGLGVAVGLAWAGFPRLRVALPLLAAGAAAALAPLGLFQYLVFGNPAGPHVEAVPLIPRYGEWAHRLLFPLEPRFVLPLCAAVALALVAVVGRRRGSRLLWWGGWSGAAVALALVAVVAGTRPRGELATSVALSAPLLLLALLPAPPDDPARPHRRLLLAVVATLVLLSWLLRFPHGGVQWGPRFLLPVFPAALVAALVSLRAPLQGAAGRVVAVGAAGALGLATIAGVVVSFRGIEQLRVMKERIASFSAAALDSGQQVLVAQPPGGASLLAPLHHQRLIFQVRGPDHLALLTERLRQEGLPGLYLLISPPQRTAPFDEVPGLLRVAGADPLPFGFEGRRFLVRGEAAGGEAGEPVAAPVAAPPAAPAPAAEAGRRGAVGR